MRARVINLLFIPFSFGTIFANSELRVKALQGNTDSQLRLAFLALNESPPDFQKTKQWLEMAAVRGNSNACYMLGVLNSSKIATPINNEKAKVWWHKGASLGDKMCMERLVRTLYEEKNYLQSKAILDLMIEAGKFDKFTKVWEVKPEFIDLDLEELSACTKDMRIKWEFYRQTPTQDPFAINKSVESLTLKNGEEFKGRTINGIPNGFGSLKKSGNRLYIGNFENGKPHGYGTLFNSDGLISFQGLWKKGTPIMKSSL